MQSPNFTDKELKNAECKKNSVKTIDVYIALPDDEKKGLKDMSEDQKADVLACCTLIPDISVDTNIFVDDDEDGKAYEVYLMTVPFKITRNNLKDGEEAGLLVHTPHFPFPKKEAWWIILGTTKQGKMISILKVADPSKEFTHNIKFLAPGQGAYNFDFHVLSNTYIGIDQKAEVEVTTLDASALPQYKVHPDDAELDDEPTPSRRCLMLILRKIVMTRTRTQMIMRMKRKLLLRHCLLLSGRRLSYKTEERQLLGTTQMMIIVVLTKSTLIRVHFPI
jgi:translocation protein SEC63